MRSDGHLVRRPGPAGTETAVKIDRVRPFGRRPCPAYHPKTGTCAAARSPVPGLILSRFCRGIEIPRQLGPKPGFCSVVAAGGRLVAMAA